MDIYTLYIIYGLVFLFIIFVALSMPFAAFAIGLRLHKIKTKNNTGIVWVKNKGNNIGMPKLVDLRSDTLEIKIGNEKKVYSIQSKPLEGISWFGCPTIIFDTDDAKTNIGLYYHQCDKEGNPLYIITKDGREIPKLESLKPSLTINPSVIRAVIDGRALTQAIKKLFDQNKTLIYILVGLGVAVALSVYFSYELKEVTMPLIETQLNEIKNICAA